MATPRQKAQLDRIITRIYNRIGAGVTINVMDISKVFAAGYAAAPDVAAMEAAIVATVAELRQN